MAKKVHDYRATALMARVMVIYFQHTEALQPRVTDLVTRFGMSRATGYRYAALARDAMGWNPPPRGESFDRCGR